VKKSVRPAARNAERSSLGMRARSATRQRVLRDWRSPRVDARSVYRVSLQAGRRIADQEVLRCSGTGVIYLPENCHRRRGWVLLYRHEGVGRSGCHYLATTRVDLSRVSLGRGARIPARPGMPTMSWAWQRSAPAWPANVRSPTSSIRAPGGCAKGILRPEKRLLAPRTRVTGVGTSMTS
jgi:hypothetical protein